MTRRLPPGPLWTTACLCALAGCASRPSAPALVDTPIYQNKQEGFRFEAPEGWKMASRAEYPPGRTEQERLLVEYRRLRGEQPASFLVSMVDLPESADPGAYLRDRPFVKSLKSTPAESLTLGGRPAQRYAFEGRPGKGDSSQEVVAVRHGERVYFFTGVFAAGDKQAREQVRRTVASLTWG